MRSARAVMVLVGSVCFTVLALYHFFHSPHQTSGERAGTLVFELLIALLGFAHFVYGLRSRAQTIRTK